MFLSEKDLSLLAGACKMDYTGFVKTYCRWVRAPATPGNPDRECLSLKEKSNFDCIFWNQGCTVYHARPVQCRTFPFWQQVISSSGAWEMAGTGCPGINSGELHTREEIEACLAAGRAAGPLIDRQSACIRGI
ncbi:zinc/iron-chelating domain-containing protein [Spirochaetia bacterium]|nr:zinc/iron-chelating domain-containing protein [Spirochaetia bacterium]